MTDKEICEMYKQGKSISYISKNFNISYGYIQKILGENQIAIRGGRKKKELPLETLGEFKKDYLDYVTFKDMSKKYNLSIETVKRLVKELNLEVVADAPEKVEKTKTAVVIVVVLAICVGASVLIYMVSKSEE